METIDSLQEEILQISTDFINLTKHFCFRVVLTGTNFSSYLLLKVMLYKCRTCVELIIISEVYVKTSGDVLHFVSFLDGVLNSLNQLIHSGVESDWFQMKL